MVCIGVMFAVIMDIKLGIIRKFLREDLLILFISIIHEIIMKMILLQ